MVNVFLRLDIPFITLSEHSIVMVNIFLKLDIPFITLMEHSILMVNIFLKLDIPFITLSEQCIELTECGKVIDGDVNSRMEFHFDAMLDQVAKWKTNATKDASLLGLISNSLRLYPSTLLCWYCQCHDMIASLITTLSLQPCLYLITLVIASDLTALLVRLCYYHDAWRTALTV